MTLTLALLLIIILPVASALAVYAYATKRSQEFHAQLKQVTAELDQAKILGNAEKKSFDERLQAKDDECTKRLYDKECACQREIDTIKESCAKLLAEKTDVCEKRILQQKNYFEQTSKTLEKQFANLASDLLTNKSRDLTQHNSEQISQILKPLKEQMDAFRLAAKEAQESNIKIGTDIQSKILSIQQTANSLGQKAEGLANALQGGNKIQGNWGESVLRTVLDSCNLARGVNYFEQDGSGGAGIPDVQVVDPEGRIAVIDSKTSLTDYVDACNATDNAVRAEKLKAHVMSVRRHIDELAKKDYITNLKRSNPGKTYLNVLAMFVPNEGAHSAAVATDPSLIQYALDRGIVIVTPLTLLGYLRLVSLAWQQDQVDKNYAEIIKQAQMLLQRLDKFYATAEDVGDKLAKATNAYESMMGLIGKRDGSQNLVTPADKLQRLGVKLEKGKSKLLTSSFDQNSDI